MRRGPSISEAIAPVERLSVERAEPRRGVGDITAPNGRRQHAQRRQRIFAVGLALLLATSTAAQDRFNEAASACQRSEQSTDNEMEVLFRRGWNELDIPGVSPDQWGLLVDGLIAAMSTTYDQEIDWTKAETQAAALPNSITSSSWQEPVRVFFTNAPVPSILLAYNRNDNEEWLQLHCVFAGELGPSYESISETMIQMNTRTGLKQASEGLDVFTLRQTRNPTQTRQKTVHEDMQWGRFTDAVSDKLGRDPKAQAGFSLFLYTQR